MTAEISLPEIITANFPRLTRKQKEIARFVLENDYFVACASANEVAERTNTSAATVVRFCQAIGFEGYAHLQQVIKKKLPRYLTTVQRIERKLAKPPTENDLAARVFSTDIDNIEHTASLLDSEMLEAAVAEIDRATGILIVGGGLSAPPALFFAHSLKVMGFPAKAITSGGVSLALELANLSSTDLLIGISFWRYLKETVEAMQRAKEMGAKRIAITDNELSPLARLADYSFLVATDGIAHSLSPVASISLINAFIAALSLKDPHRTLRSLRKVDALYKESKLLLEE